MSISVSRVTLYLSPHHDLYHSSYIIAACSALSGRGITTSIELDGTVDPIVPRVHVGEVRIAIDLHDSSKRFSDRSWRECDVYAKRSYFARDVPVEYGAKVVPFGLNYACRTFAGATALVGLFVRHPATVAGMRPWIYARLPRAAQFECDPQQEVEPTILFQTRVWERHEIGPGDDINIVNGRRVALVLALRRAFGRRFKGGLIPTPLAKREYPEAITTEPSGSGRYLRNVGHALVTISTRGLHNSTPFKMLEYLAASKCIVTEPMQNAPAVPLTQGVNYLTFEEVQECLSRCDALLSNVKVATDMRHANWEHYQRYLRFDRRILLLANQARDVPWLVTATRVHGS